MLDIVMAMIYDYMIVNTALQLRRPHLTMILTEISRICYVCKKLFCCAQCRERHEEKKHTKRYPNCPFCMNQKLPLKFFEDKALLCHIVITHLPLHCCLCGEVFKQSKDFESFGPCKWWKSQRHSLISGEQKSIGTPPLPSEESGSPLFNDNCAPLTSPPELHRNTSTPMILGQKASFDFKTPNVPNFSLKTPVTNSASSKNSETRSDLQENNSKCDNSSSNYVIFPSTTHEETPFHSVPSKYENKEEFSHNKSKNLDNMKDNINPTECSNNCELEDMELTNIEDEILPDSQGTDKYQGEKRSDSTKKVRFSDQYDDPSEPNSTTENEEYFEACETLSDMKESLQKHKSQIKLYEDNAKNIEKENHNPSKVNVIDNNEQASSSSRIIMMVVVENNSNVSTSDVIDSSLKKLKYITSNFTTNNQSSSSCNSMTSLDSYYSISNSPLSESSNSSQRDSNVSSNSNSDSSNSGGILSVVTNAVKSVMRNFSTMASSKTVASEISKNEDSPTSSTSDTFDFLSNFASSLSQRPGKRSRDAIESSPTKKSTEFVIPQIEVRSPIAKRQCGWYKIKAREPIARMKNNRPPRRVSLETQVFHQGSLSVGNTVLPLPDRAHQSTQTE